MRRPSWSVLLGLGTVTCGVAMLPANGWAVQVGFEATGFGNSPAPIGAGARAMGMGGAFVAIADDGTANTWNPAGMSQLDAPELGISVGYYRRTSQRAGGSEDSDQVDVDHLSYVHPSNLFGFQQTFGIAWQRQYDFTFAQSFASNERTVDQSQDTIIDSMSSVDVRQRGAFSSLSLSYAIEVSSRLSFGITGHVWRDDLTQNSEYRKDYTYSSEDTAIVSGNTIAHTLSTLRIANQVEVQRGHSWALGTMWRPTSALTLAATWKPRYSLHLTDHQQVDETVVNLLNNTTTITPTTNSDIDEIMTFPTAVAVGGAWRWNDLQTIATDITWTRWREYTLSRAGETTSPVNYYVPPADFHDGYTVRIGYEHILVTPWAMFVPRVGALYEGLPGVTEAPSLGAPDQVHATTDHYYGATLGLSMFQRTFIYDVATQLRYGRGVAAGAEAPPDQSANVTSWTVRAAITVQF